MAERYVLITTSKFRKGVQVGVQKTGTRAEVEAYRSEKHWVGKRPQPHIIPESEVAAFTKQHQSGIFVPTYDPVAAVAAEAAKIRRQKEQEKFERERAAAKAGDRTAQLLVQSKYGIQPKRVITPTTTPDARRVGYTGTGGTFDIPITAKYSPGYSEYLAKPTGKEKAKEIVMGWRRQTIEPSKLPIGSVLMFGKQEVPIERAETIEPGYGVLGGRARVVKSIGEQIREREESLKRVPVVSGLEGEYAQKEIPGILPFKTSSKKDYQTDSISFSNLYGDNAIGSTGFRYGTKRILASSLFGYNILSDNIRSSKIGSIFKIGGKNDTRNGRSIDGLDNVRVSSMGGLSLEKQEKTTSKRFIFGSEKGPGLLAPVYFLGSAAKGAGKLLYAPNIVGGKPLIDIGQSKIFSTKGKPLISDPDVQATAVVGGLALAPIKVAKLAYAGFLGLGAYKAIKEPIPENIGAVTGLATLPFIIKGVSAVKYETLDIPTPKGTTTVYKGLTVESGARGKPLLGVAEGKVKIGTPKVDLAKADLSKGFVVETPAQTAIIRKSITDLYKKPEVQKLEYGMTVMRATEKTPSKFITKKFIEETKTLRPKGVKEVLEFAKKEKADVYGSFAARQQMPLELSRKSADIDVQLTYGAEKATLKTKQLVTKLKAKGEQVRVSEQSPTLIEAKIKGEWHHAVDIHTKTDVLSDLKSPAVAAERAYGLRLAQKPIKIEKVKVMPLSEQGIRKGVSTLTMREKGFAPEPHRIKDIPDFFVAQEVLLKSKKIPAPKAKYALERMKELYPKEVLEKAGIEPVKVQIYKPKIEGIATERGVPIIPYKPGIEHISPQSKERVQRIYKQAKIGMGIKTYPIPSSKILKPSKPSPKIYQKRGKIEYPSRVGIEGSIEKSISKAIKKQRSSAGLYVVSPSMFISPSPSKSISRSVSRSFGYPSPKPSPYPSRSISKSVSKSISRSPYKSLSKSVSRSMSRPYKPYYPYYPPGKPPSRKIPPPFLPFKKTQPPYRRKKKKQRGFDYFYRQFKVLDIKQALDGKPKKKKKKR